MALVATLPLLAVAALAAAQLVAAGQALWSAAVGARAGARADLVGRDPDAAARAALPPRLREGAEVSERDGAIRVRVRTPALAPGLPRNRVAARAGLGEGDG